jgi:hypothetical protein
MQSFYCFEKRISPDKGMKKSWRLIMLYFTAFLWGKRKSLYLIKKIETKPPENTPKTNTQLNKHSIMKFLLTNLAQRLKRKH